MYGGGGCHRRASASGCELSGEWSALAVSYYLGVAGIDLCEELRRPGNAFERETCLESREKELGDDLLATLGLSAGLGARSLCKTQSTCPQKL